MKRQYLLLIALWLSVANNLYALDIKETTESYGIFGTVHIYKTSDTPTHVVLFISGDGGWNLGVVDMARSLALLDSMVVGIDITHYIKELNGSADACSYGAAHFEELSQYLQKKYNFPHYVPPLLVGYSSGATMVYTVLAQSPPNTFAGAISMGFCPDLKTSKPFCKGNGALTYTVDKKLGFIYEPVERVVAPWAVLQGDIDQVCSTPDTKVFVSKVEQGEMVELPKVGHGFSVPKNWMPQFKNAFINIYGQQTPFVQPEVNGSALKDLPLVELPLDKRSDTMAVIISGDGGWASLDKSIGEALNKEGIPVVGLNSLQYFWSKKTPDISGVDLENILTNYASSWHKDKFILVGYSQGADVLPFMISRLPPELKKKISKTVLLGLEENVDFEFHVSNWLPSSDSGQHKVLPELEKLKGMAITCIYGDEETDSACTKIENKEVRVIKMKGGHHFGGDYKRLAAIVLGNEGQDSKSP